jgi:hypothetical protein
MGPQSVQHDICHVQGSVCERRVVCMSGMLSHLCIFLCFPSLSYSNPHSFVMAVMILFILIFHPLTACLRVQYSTR